MNDQPVPSLEEMQAQVDREQREAHERLLAAREGRLLQVASESDLSMALLETERRLLETEDVGDVLELHDKASALSTALRSTKRNLGLQQQSAALKLRAARRAGELLASLERGRWIKSDEPVEIGSPYGRVLRDEGLDDRRARRFEEIAAIPGEVFDAYVPGMAELQERLARLHDQDPAAAEALERLDLSTNALLRFAKRAAGTDAAGTAHDEWPSPPEVLTRSEAVLGRIDLDPCADRKRTVSAARHFDAASDGLAQTWDGPRLYVHPPRSQTALFVDKLLQERAAGRFSEAIILLAAPISERRWGAPWWDALAAHPVCVVSQQFAARSPYPLTIVSYIGPQKATFATTFSTLGWVPA